MSAQQAVVLEPAAQEFADATSKPPFIYQLSPGNAREVLEEVQRSPVSKPDVEIEDITIAGGPHGDVAVRVIKPAGVTGPLPALLYIHGAGWV
ncbi:MAG TPA: esterase, partial [Trebonia sp.]|nr:esterase [Trebonia sp.]